MSQLNVPLSVPSVAWGRLTAYAVDQLLRYQGRKRSNHVLETLPGAISKWTLMVAKSFPVSRTCDFVRRNCLVANDDDTEQVNAKWDQIRFLSEVIVPIVLGACVGCVACKYLGGSLWMWSLDFFVVGGMYSVRKVIKSYVGSQVKKRLLTDLLSAIKVCVYLVLDRRADCGFPFFAHFIHGLLTTFAGRNLARGLTSNYIYRGIVRKISFVVLISPVQRIFNRPLQYSLMFMCVDIIACYLVGYVLSLLGA